jgi:hypothetical protein
MLGRWQRTISSRHPDDDPTVENERYPKRGEPSPEGERRGHSVLVSEQHDAVSTKCISKAQPYHESHKGLLDQQP